MTIQYFIKLFGTKGHNERFENCQAKNGDKSTGEYFVEYDKVYYTYTDSKGLPYDSSEPPTFYIDLTKQPMNIKQTTLTEMKLLLAQFNKVSEQVLTEEFNSDEQIQSLFGDSYPFEDSFDDICIRVEKWVQQFESNIDINEKLVEQDGECNLSTEENTNLNFGKSTLY